MNVHPPGRGKIAVFPNPVEEKKVYRQGFIDSKGIFPEK